MIQPGDILLCKAGNDPLSKIIAWGTKSFYSHVAVCLNPGENTYIDSVPGGGVRIRDLRTIEAEYNVFRIKKEYPYNLQGVIDYLMRRIGCGYDFRGVLWLGVLKIPLLLRMPVQPIANRFQKEKDYFCSELCYKAFYEGGGLDIVPDIPEAAITSPADIANSRVVIRL